MNAKLSRLSPTAVYSTLASSNSHKNWWVRRALKIAQLWYLFLLLIGKCGKSKWIWIHFSSPYFWPQWYLCTDLIRVDPWYILAKWFSTHEPAQNSFCKANYISVASKGKGGLPKSYMWWQGVQGAVRGSSPRLNNLWKFLGICDDCPSSILVYIYILYFVFVIQICILWNKCMTVGGWQLLVWKENFTFCCLYFYSIFWICNSNLYLILWKKSMTVGGWQLLIWKENFTDKSQPQIFLPGADFSFQTTLFGINSKLLKTFWKSWQLENYS